MICVFCANKKEVTEMPMALPTLRMSAKRAVPSVRKLRRQRRKGDDLQRNEHEAEPEPCTTVVIAKGQARDVGRPARHLPEAARKKHDADEHQVGADRYGSSSRPATIMATMVPTPRGAISSPAVLTG